MTRRSALPPEAEALLARKETEKVFANAKVERSGSQKRGRWYARQKRRQRDRYARAKAKRPTIDPAGMNQPWNRRGGEFELHLCDSVKAMLYSHGEDANRRIA